MLKTALIASAVMFGVAAPTQLETADLQTAEPTAFHLPAADVVVAQLSYLEISHGADGFQLSVTDETGVFVNFEFAGNRHVRIGF